MRVCLITASAGIGGLENHVIALANGLLRHLEVTLIADESYREKLSDKVDFIPFDFSGSRLNPFTSRRLKAIVQKVQPTVIHVHANKAVKICSSFKNNVNIPMIASLHNKKRSLSMFKKMDCVVGVSNGVLENVQHANKRAVYNGVEPYTGESPSKEELRTLLGIKNNLPICVSVGRYAPVKAYDRLIQSFQGLDANLVLIGDGGEREMLEKLVKECQLEERVILTGFRNDVRALLPSCDLFVMSSFHEGFSYAFIEALLARLPVISTKVPGCVELLDDKFLLDNNEPEYMKEQIKEFFALKEEREEVLNALFERAENELTAEVMIQNFFNLYQKETGKRKA